MPLDIVQVLLGRTDPQTTQLYARLSLAAARQEYDRAMAGLGGRKAALSAKGEIAAPLAERDPEGA